MVCIARYPYTGDEEKAYTYRRLRENKKNFNIFLIPVSLTKLICKSVAGRDV